jgi:deoxyribodipyrimidine photolyase
LAETGADAIFAQEEYAPHAIERDTESACVIGRDYPAPILDHGRARERAMEFFGNTRKAIKTY